MPKAKSKQQQMAAGAALAAKEGERDRSSLKGEGWLRIVTSVNRGMKALSASFARRGFGYVSAQSGVVLFAGAGGMYCV